MNGQSFSFHGYLPIETPNQLKKIKELESIAARFGSTQIFMETPYRNNQLIETLLKTCKATTMICIAEELTSINEFINTKLCIACDINLPTEFIQTKSVKEWRQEKPDIHKRPAIFLINM